MLKEHRMNKGNLKILVVFVAIAMSVVAIQCILANSSTGFSSTNISQATVGIRALMLLMMDWNSVFYIGIPAGVLLFGICKLLHIDFGTPKLQ